MTSIRKFVYATLLAATTLSFTPSLASAQEKAYGKFTLTHEVHWQNAVVPAGEYRFSLDSGGALGVLTLSKLSGVRTGFMFLVRDTEQATPSDHNLLVLQNTSDGSYVSAMNLPEFGVTLNFAVPPSTTGKQMAKAATMPQPSVQ